MRSKWHVVLGALLAAWVLLGVLASANPTTITWLKWGDVEPYGQLVRNFEADNPDIKVVIQTADWFDIRERVIVGVAAGVAPDVVSVSSGWGEAMEQAGVLLDLRPLLQADTEFDTSSIFAAAWTLWQAADGAQYAFPHDFDINIPYVNVDMFSRAGLTIPSDNWSWADMRDVSARLTRDVDGDGELDEWGFSPWYMDYWSLVWSNGGDILSPDYMSSALDSQAAREALEYFADFWPQRNGYIPSLEYDWDVMFRRGRVGIQPGGPWYISTLQASRVAFSYDVVGMPYSPNGTRATTLGGSSIGIVSSTPHTEAAYRFIKFLASEEVQAMMASEIGAMPVLQPVAVSPAFLAGEARPQNMQAYVEATSYGRPNPKTIYWTDIRDAFYQEIHPYLRGETFLGQALDNFNVRVRAIVAR